METLIFLLVTLSTNLVLSDDNVAIESGGGGYQVHAPPEETNTETDQLAQSSHVITQKESRGETLKFSDRNHDVRYTYEVQNVLEQPEAIRPIVVDEGGSHSYPGVVYSHHPTHQVQIFDAQASPLHQVYDREHTIGYQTYVEHGEDEEIKSALKENSLGDIKRLVPKSGISFKIYHNEKSPKLKVTEHEIETHPVVPVVTTTQPAQKEFPNSVLHHRTRVQAAPVQQLHVQTTQELDKPEEVYLSEHHTITNQLPVGDIQHEGLNQRAQVYYAQQEVSSPRPVVYVQPEVSSPVPILEITGKGTADPPYKTKLRDDHVRATSIAEFNKKTAGHRQETNNLRYQQSRKNFHKTIKQPKPENVQYQKELTEGVQKLAVSHNEGLGSFVTHEQSHPYSGGLKASGNGFLHGQFADAKTGQAMLNRLSGSYINEGIKSGSVVSHLGATAYAESQYKNTQNNIPYAYADNEGAKTQIGHGAQYDVKSSPNNFDHQKALEGSTSFDIKNAIGITENVDTHAGYVSTTEIHPTEEIQKQQLVYNLPSVPTVLIENSILKTPVEGHQIKTVPQFAYHPQEIGGKFYRQPQFVWTAEHFKQGNDLHQPLIKLHIPKEEIQFVKNPKVEMQSIITHQPFLAHQNALYKPHEFYFQHKKHPQGHQANLKLSQPVIIDWSLFKSKFPNVNINSLTVKPELLSYIQDPTKKIMPILVRKRKNRSNNKEVGVVYGKATNRGPVKPNQRQEKNVHVNLVPSASNDVKQYERKGERKNEFSVSASYKVDRSYKSSS